MKRLPYVEQVRLFYIQNNTVSWLAPIAGVTSTGFRHAVTDNKMERS